MATVARPLARNPGNPNMRATREVLKNAFAAFAANAPPRRSAAQARDVLEVVAGCYVVRDGRENGSSWAPPRRRT